VNVILKRTETGKWALLELEDEDVGTIFFALNDYWAQLSKEQREERIMGVPCGPEDMEFLHDASPRAKRVLTRIQELEDQMEREGLI
jgi:hypothetical protein